MVALDEEGAWYRFHPLFRESLRRRLSERQRTEIHKRASRWFAARGDVQGAVHHAIEAGRPDEAVDILWRLRLDLVNGEQWGELMDLVHRVPDAVQERRVELMLLRAAWVQPDDLPPLIARIEAQLPPDASDDIRGELEALRAFLFYDQSQVERGVPHAREALRLLRPECCFARASAYFLLAQACQVTGDREGALAALERGGGELSRTGGSPYAYIQVGRCYVHWAEAEFALLREPALLAIESGKPHSRGIARGFLARWHLHTGDPSAAEEALRHPEVQPHGDAVCLLALAQAAQGKFREAAETADELMKRVIDARAAGLADRVRALEAELALAEGQPERALDWARSFKAGPLTYMHHDIEPAVTQAKILSAVGAEGARDVMSAVRAYAERTHNRRVIEELEHGSWLPFEGTRHPAASASEMYSMRRLASSLTDREFDVLDLLAQRLSNKEIAAQLHIAPQTVKHHTLKIYSKLDVKKRREAVLRAIELGLLASTPNTT